MVLSLSAAAPDAPAAPTDAAVPDAPEPAVPAAAATQPGVAATPVVPLTNLNRAYIWACMGYGLLPGVAAALVAIPVAVLLWQVLIQGQPASNTSDAGMRQIRNQAW